MLPVPDVYAIGLKLQRSPCKHRRIVAPQALLSQKLAAVCKIPVTMPTFPTTKKQVVYKRILW